MPQSQLSDSYFGKISK
jgi:hypothetical protein